MGFQTKIVPQAFLKRHVKNPILKSCLGLTLIELLVALLIFSMLSGMAYPQFKRIRLQWEVRTTIQTIEHSLERLKVNALSLQTEMILCGSEDGHRCQQDWSKGFIQFADTNGNRQRDADEPLMEQFAGLSSSSGQLFAQKKRYFRTWRNGALASQMGSIWYCPQAPYQHLTHRIVVSRIGRVRIENRADHPELQCPEAPS